MTDWTNCPDVERTLGKLSGAWCVRGTRIPVQAIIDNAEAGCSAEEIAGPDIFAAYGGRGLHLAGECLVASDPRIAHSRSELGAEGLLQRHGPEGAVVPDPLTPRSSSCVTAAWRSDAGKLR